MKNKLISVLYFFLASVVSFGIYSYTAKTENIVLPLFACLAFGAIVAVGVDHYKNMPAK